jgi:hypothetical protein
MFIGNNSPTMLTVAGVGGFIATTALAIHATLKAEKEIPYIRENIRAIKEAVEETEGTTEKDKARALTKVYAENSVTLAKIYWPTIVTGSVSIVCVLSAHKILVKRNASLVAAYTALDVAYRAYRARVREELGEERELALYSGVKMRKLEEGEEGFDPNAPCEIIDQEDKMPSPYARFFDSYSPCWVKTAEYNMMFLRSQQQWANDRLEARGYLFLNEVYDALGLKWDQKGQVVGWKFKTDTGDGYVDFGLNCIGDESSRAFTNGHEPVVLLDFNVDGVIRI